jgi:hypothetical protein
MMYNYQQESAVKANVAPDLNPAAVRPHSSTLLEFRQHKMTVIITYLFGVGLINCV